MTICTGQVSVYRFKLHVGQYFNTKLVNISSLYRSQWSELPQRPYLPTALSTCHHLSKHLSLEYSLVWEPKCCFWSLRYVVLNLNPCDIAYTIVPGFHAFVLISLLFPLHYCLFIYICMYAHIHPSNFPINPRF